MPMMNSFEELLSDEMEREDFIDIATTEDGDLIDLICFFSGINMDRYEISDDGELVYKDSIYESSIAWIGDGFI